jgi:hypothetical protein
MASQAIADLFDEPARHDPGGKVSTPLPKGMRGGADFYGEREEYRLLLWRYWDEATKDDPFILWIGMNPSTATGEANDPTVTREINFSKEWGFKRYVKCNILDYRATHPTDLVKPFVVPRSDKNLETIRRLADAAEQIIVCYGVMHRPLQPYAFETVKALEADGHRLFCMGTTLSGHPRHPLYLKADTKPEPFVYAEPIYKKTSNLIKGRT